MTTKVTREMLYVPVGEASVSGMVQERTGGGSSYDFALSGYSDYEFVLSSVQPVTNNVSLNMYVSTDNGSTFPSGGSDYLYTKWEDDTAAASGASGSVSSSAMVVQANVADSTSWGVTGRIWAPDLSITFARKVFQGRITRLSNGASTVVSAGWAGSYNVNNDAITNVRFSFSSGNISRGTIRCYGRL